MLTDVCSQTKVVGSCRGSFRRWWYNRRSGQCEEFVYSGCQGNENRFATPDDCNMRCVNREEKKGEDVFFIINRQCVSVGQYIQRL